MVMVVMVVVVVVVVVVVMVICQVSEYLTRRSFSIVMVVMLVVMLVLMASWNQREAGLVIVHCIEFSLYVYDNPVCVCVCVNKFMTQSSFPMVTIEVERQFLLRGTSRG